MTLEEYLSLSFPDSATEPEFVRDHLEERPVPDDTHAAVQSYLAFLTNEAAKKAGIRIFGRSERRVRIQTSVRLPDYLIYLESPQSSGLVTKAPYAAFEIASPDDRLPAMLEKLNEYLDWGVQHVFLIEPHDRKIYRFSREGLLLIDTIELSEISLRASIDDLLQGA